MAGILAGEWLPARIWDGDDFGEYTFSGPFTLALIITGPFWLALLAQTGDLMVASGCDLLQGYFLLPPTPADVLMAWGDRPRAWTGGRRVPRQPGGPGLREPAAR